MNYAELQAVINRTDAAYNAPGATAAEQQAAVAERQAAVAAYRNRGSGQPAAAAAPGKSAFELQREEDRRQLAQTLEAYFQQMGLGEIASWAKQQAKDGYSEEYIRLNVRNLDQYKRRFPAMQHYLDNQLGFTEQDYLNYEQLARNLDQQYGLPGNMIYNAVTDLLVNEVDAEELAGRAQMAAAAAVQAPEDFKETMRNLYGIDEGGLAGYFLDPDNIEATLQKEYAASMISTVGSRQGVPNVARELAEDLYDRGVRDESQIREGFALANQYQGLQGGKGEVLDQETLVRGSFGDSEAQKAMNRIAESRKATQRGGGGYVSNQEGAPGLR